VSSSRARCRGSCPDRQIVFLVQRLDARAGAKDRIGALLKEQMGVARDIEEGRALEGFVDVAIGFQTGSKMLAYILLVISADHECVRRDVGIR